MKKDNIILFIVIATPILLILLMLGCVYLPQFVVKPQYDFLYSQKNYCGVENIKYSIEIDEPVNLNNCRKIYYFDIEKNRSMEVSSEYIQSLTIDSNRESPDGFELAYGRNRDPFFIYLWETESIDHFTIYLKNNNFNKKLNIFQEEYRYNGFVFLGWIKK